MQPIRLSVSIAVLTVAVLLSPSRSAGLPTDVSPPQLDRAPDTTLELKGHIRTSIDAITSHWLLRAPDANPAMLAMFADRDREPYRDLLPWSGEFAGKYLTAGTQVLRVTGDPALKQHLQAFVDKLVALQADDGYLGPFPKASRLTGKAPNVGPKGGDTWDAWGHYHVMLGLLLWHETAGDKQALACAQRIGDLLCARFLNTGTTIVSTGSSEMNLAVAHSLALLYRKTGVRKYLELSRQAANEFALPGAGDYRRLALAGKEFFQGPKPRWESLHPILALAELHALNGDANDRVAFERLWWSIAKLDRHNNGGFSSGEQAQGNPYHGGAIETCCTIAWMAMTVEQLRMTGNSIAADELELSTLNQVVGLHSPDGAWCTYNTPMGGVRKPSTVDIAFQKRPGSEELNCCSVNAARGFGMISDWALMTEKRRDGGAGALVLNWYGPGTLAATVPGGPRVELAQLTHYPESDAIVLTVNPAKQARFCLKLRVPHWSTSTSIVVNGDLVKGVKPGTYCDITRQWNAGDRVVIQLDFSPQMWVGERECAGKVSLYRGPLLMAYEPARPDGPLPSVDLKGIAKHLRMPPVEGGVVQLDVPVDGGDSARFIDYGSAGIRGKRYVTWLPARDVKPTEYAPSNPSRRVPISINH